MVNQSFNNVKEGLKKRGIKRVYERAKEAEENYYKDLESGNTGYEKEIAEINEKINEIKNRKWLFEGDPVHQVVKERLDSKKYENMLGVAHQAQASRKCFKLFLLLQF